METALQVCPEIPDLKDGKEPRETQEMLDSRGLQDLTVPMDHQALLEPQEKKDVQVSKERLAHEVHLVSMALRDILENLDLQVIPDHRGQSDQKANPVLMVMKENKVNQDRVDLSVFPESLVLEVPLVSKDLKDFLELKGQQEKPDQRVTEDFRDQWDNEAHQGHRVNKVDPDQVDHPEHLVKTARLDPQEVPEALVNLVLLDPPDQLAPRVSRDRKEQRVITDELDQQDCLEIPDPKGHPVYQDHQA